MAYNIPTKILIILLIGYITLESFVVGTSNALLPSVKNSSHTGEVLSSEISEELSFNYTDSFSESTFSTHIINLSIGFLNELKLNFIVEGDQSTKSGITIIFSYGDIEIEFIIERIYQDGAIHQINKTFYSTLEFQGDYNFSVYFAGEASYGKSGVIAILTSSTFSKLPLIDLNEEVQLLTFTPSTFSFEGNLFGAKQFHLVSVVNNSLNHSYSINLGISFDANDFQSFQNEILIFLNDAEQDTINFEPNIHTDFSVEFKLVDGLNFLELVFQIDMSSNIIEISNLIVQANLFLAESVGETFHTISWEGTIDETIDLSALKPLSPYNEHIVNISLVLSFEGTVIYTGISYSVSFGETEIKTGSISSSKQTSEAQVIKIEGFTQNYQETLSLALSASNSGSGEIFFYDSSSIVIKSIEHISDGVYGKTLENEIEIQTPSFGSAVKTYYDVFFIEESEQLFRLNLSLTVQTTDLNYESITIYGKTNKIILFTKSIRGLGEHTISEEVSLIEGYNEIELVLNILGKGAIVTIKNIFYSIQPENEVEQPLPNDQKGIFNIPLFKTPQNIALALFVLFDCWLLLGIFLRLYRGFKAKKKLQAENDEYILEIAQISQNK